MIATAILYGLSVLILSCAVSWLLSRLRNGRPRRHRLLSRQEMRALRRRGPNLRALENWSPLQIRRLNREIHKGCLTLPQVLAWKTLEEVSRSADPQRTGRPNGTGLLKSGRTSGL